jgi:L-ascorbate metabolism protein UlaG (beta-lactamase superfamily)
LTKTLVILLLCLLAVIAVVVKLKSQVRYKGPASNHFDGSRFYNQVNAPAKSIWNVIYWRVIGHHSPWPTEVLPSPNLPLPSPAEDEIVVTFVNHASSLIQTGTVNILTDPQYNDHASPVSWAGPVRVHEPGIAYENLPKVDVVIISHDHYDHMDERTLKMLYKDHKPLFLVGLGNDAHLKAFGITDNVKTVDWWQSVEVGDAKMTFVPAQHFSGRGLFDRNSTLWGGYVIQVGKENLFFAGDTGYGPHFKEIQERFGPMDLSMIPIGSYCPRWFMKAVHVNPEEAVLSHLDLKSKKSFGIHFKTFQMSDEPYDQPVMDLELAKKQYQIPAEDFVAPEFGESFIVRKTR